MNNSKLKSRLNSLLALFTLMIFITACNNSDESVNNSTDTSANNMGADTSSGRMSDTSMSNSNKTTGAAKTTKKRGRAFMK